MTVTAQLQQLLKQNSPLIAPGIYDGLSARIAEQAGFSAVYASGGAIARSTGVPDIGLLSLTEVTERLRQIVNITKVPVIADADTGFGNELNVRRTVSDFIAAGVAGLHMEDQVFPKRCGHLDGKTLIAAQDMCKKIEVARKTIADDDFLLIARTDAIAVEGFAAAIQRGKDYLNAGAHMLFVEAPQSLEQIQQIADEISAPKLINMFYGGKTPLVPIDQLQAMGYQLVIIPSDLQRAAITAMQRTLTAIKTHGDSSSLADDLASFNDREAIIRTHEYLEWVK